ncbi:MAG: tripartite tricarboxylate transporter substrate binding protein [Burkholderiales bacterium]|nr:tripartite tricarboxylate transporter substrate binding protein [Burkholderiales bacterium]
MKRLAATLALALASLGAAAQDFPAKAITFVVPFAAGSATDTFARAVGQAITAETKQAVVVENKPGASGMIAAAFVAKAQADGYTVLFTTNTTHAANEHLYKKLSYDPVKDFAPLSGLGKGGQVMVVRNDLPVKTVQEFIAHAKKNPGKVNFASGSSSSRIAGELLQQMAGIQLLHVPYKSNPLGITDMLGGTIDMMITDTTTGLPQVQAGKLRALAYSADKRSRLAPDLPTISEAGVNGYEMSYWFAAYAPAGTPPAVVRRLNALLVAATKSGPVTSFYDKTGVDPFTTTPEELAAFQAAETKKWGDIIRKAGIQPE